MGWAYRLKRYSLYFLGFLVLAALVGLLYQSIATANDLERFPPPGELIEVDGSLMHLHCQGSGSPTVVTEQGLGGFSSLWDLVHAEIASVTRVCAYDRVGMGYSEYIGRPLSNDEVITRLHTLLEIAGEEDDLVLVGWSAGGIYIRDYQRKYPERVKGMVFVDSSHEQQTSRLPVLEADTRVEDGDRLMALGQHFTRFGIFRATGLVRQRINFLAVDDSLREKALAQYHFSHALSAQLAEAEGFRSDLALNKELTPLGDMPLAVLTQGRPITLSESAPEFLTMDYLLEQRAVWNELQEELAALSSNSEHIIATESGHSIHFDAPELLVETVLNVVEKVHR